MNNRTQTLLTSLQKSNLQAIALNPGPTLTYLTGLQFHLMERPTVLILTREGKAALILPLLESAKIGENLAFLKCFTYGDNPSTWINSFHEAVKYLELADGDIGCGSESAAIFRAGILERGNSCRGICGFCRCDCFFADGKRCW